MSHPVHIHCTSTVRLPARPFTSVGTQSGAVRRAFLTSRPGAWRMPVPMLIQARRSLQSSYTRTLPARRADLSSPDIAVLRGPGLGAVASIALMVLMCVIGAACSGMLHL